VLGLTWHNPQLDNILTERGHTAIDALDIAGLRAALHHLLRQWETDTLADNTTSSPFTVENAVDRIVALTDKIRTH